MADSPGLTTIFEHPDWPMLVGYLYIRRGHDGVNGPRHRIEVSHDAPPRVFEIQIACAYCGRTITPVRRDARGAWTFNLSCPLAIDPKCARMPATTAACTKVRDAIATGPPRVGGLFEAGV